MIRTMAKQQQKNQNQQKQQHSYYTLIFCLLLLLSISTATDSFQRNLQRRPKLKQHQRRLLQFPSSFTISSPPSQLTITAVPVVDVSDSSSTTTKTKSKATTIVIASEKAINNNRRRRRRRRRSLWNKILLRNTNGKIDNDIINGTRKIDLKQQKKQQKRLRQYQQRRKRNRKRRKAALQLPSSSSSSLSSSSLDNDKEYQRRKKEWVDRYTTIDGLRDKFGTNKNKFFGDLDVQTTRKLYKSLLPTAVCELVINVDVRPEELAPLAYEARKAAKLYARERCYVIGRWLAHWYDGYRQWKSFGKFQIYGLSYDQVFDKYYQRSTLERKRQQFDSENDVDNSNIGDDDDDEWSEEDIISQTCIKILESACRTNPLIDQMTLGKRREQERAKKNGRLRRGKRRRRGKSKVLLTNDERGYGSSSSNNNGDDVDVDEHKNLMTDDDDYEQRERENLEKIARILQDDVHKLLNPYNN